MESGELNGSNTKRSFLTGSQQPGARAFAEAVTDASSSSRDGFQLFTTREIWKMKMPRLKQTKLGTYRVGRLGVRELLRGVSRSWRAFRRQSDLPPDIQQAKDFLRVYGLCGPYTMTSLERVYALWEAVRYVVRADVPGSIVECGVWKGGSCMLCAATLMELESPSRDIVLYDTFEATTAPGAMDVQYDGTAAQDLWKVNGGNWCEAGLEEVRANMDRTGYPKDHLVFVKGKVEETLQSNVPGCISLLRLDTDWFQSTSVELKTLFPLLSEGGVLIIDDYGHWRGQKQAVDSYFQEAEWPILFNRVDYTCRIGVKLASAPREGKSR